jgi:O-antigen/teichoic acid export membrane protein
MSTASALGAVVGRREGLRRALTLSAVGTFGARATGAVGGLLAARLLGPAGRGQFAIVMFFGLAMSLVLTAGMQFWIARAVAIHRGVRAVGEVLWTHATVVLVGAILSGALVGRIVQSTADVGAATAWMVAVVAATSALQLLVLALPNGLRAMGVVAIATVMAGAIYVAATTVLLVVGTDAVVPVLVGVSLGNVASTAFVLGWKRRAPQGTGAELVGRSAYLGALRFGAPAGGGELVLFAMFRIDVVLVAAFLPMRDVGWYAVATALAEVLWILPDAVAQVVLPTTAHEPDAARTRRLVWGATIATAVAGLLMISVAKPLVEIAFGTRFAPASTVVPLLVAASLAGGAWKILGADVVALGASLPRLTSAAVGLAVLVAVDIVAVPTAGIDGAAFGSLCGYAAAALVVAVSWRRHVAEVRA